MKSSEFIKKYSLTLYFITTYLLMIIAVVLRLLWDESFIIYWFLSAWNPTISAILISWLIGGWKQVKILLRGFLKWKVGLKWYFAAFLIMIAPLIFAGMYLLFGGTAPGPVPGLTFPLILFYLLITLLSGPLSEEAGWRGFALPKLESRFNALNSSLILGLIWGCWHIPLYFVESRIPFYIFIFLNLVISILITWGYNNTNGSLIITVIFHFSFNFNGAFITGYFGLLPQMIFYIGGGIMIGFYLIVVIIYAGPKRLSRKPDSEMQFNIQN
jgi:membrane protease YdiL (CAAX protease family)